MGSPSCRSPAPQPDDQVNKHGTHHSKPDGIVSDDKFFKLQKDRYLVADEVLELITLISSFDFADQFQEEPDLRNNLDFVINVANVQFALESIFSRDSARCPKMLGRDWDKDQKLVFSALVHRKQPGISPADANYIAGKMTRGTVLLPRSVLSDPHLDEIICHEERHREISLLENCSSDYGPDLGQLFNKAFKRLICEIGKLELPAVVLPLVETNVKTYKDLLTQTLYRCPEEFFNRCFDGERFMFSAYGDSVNLLSRYVGMKNNFLVDAQVPRMTLCAWQEQGTWSKRHPIYKVLRLFANIYGQCKDETLEDLNALQRGGFLKPWALGNLLLS